MQWAFLYRELIIKHKNKKSFSLTLANLHRYQYLTVTRPQTVLLPLQSQLYPCTKYCYPWKICEQIAPLYTTLVESSDSTVYNLDLDPCTIL